MVVKYVSTAASTEVFLTDLTTMLTNPSFTLANLTGCDQATSVIYNRSAISSEYVNTGWSVVYSATGVRCFTNTNQFGNTNKNFCKFTTYINGINVESAQNITSGGVVTNSTYLNATYYPSNVLSGSEVYIIISKRAVYVSSTYLAGVQEMTDNLPNGNTNVAGYQMCRIYGTTTTETTNLTTNYATASVQFPIAKNLVGSTNSGTTQVATCAELTPAFFPVGISSNATHRYLNFNATTATVGGNYKRVISPLYMNGISNGVVDYTYIHHSIDNISTYSGLYEVHAAYQANSQGDLLIVGTKQYIVLGKRMVSDFLSYCVRIV